MEKNNLIKDDQKMDKLKKIKNFFKDYRYLFIAGALILFATVLISAINSNLTNGKPVDVNNGNVVFSMPVLNSQVTKGYSSTELQYDDILNVWEIHKAVDFKTAKGTNVYCALDGTVSSIETNLLDGTVVTVSHADGLVTKYASLDSDVEVAVGDSVKGGDVIGTAGGTSATENLEEVSVHFEIWKDGTAVDPAGYLEISVEK